MAPNTLEPSGENTLQLLTSKEVSTIVLVGTSEIGNTWMARKITGLAISKDLFDITLWAYLDKKYDKITILKSFARQMSLLPTTNERVNDDNDEVEEDKDEKFEVLHQKISSKLPDQQRLLLVLDKEGREMKTDEFMDLLHFPQLKTCKKLITSVNEDGRHKSTNDTKVIKVKHQSTENSLSMLQKRSRTDEVLYRVLIDYSRQGSHFFRDRGIFHFSELIAYWIMEGYFGHIRCIEKAYEEGHRVLMDLIDCEMLKKIEEDNIKGNYIRMASMTLNLDKNNRHGFCRTARLGLANVFGDANWDGFGEVTQADGMLKSVPNIKNKLSTLLLDGNQNSREVLTNFFQSKQDLKVLAFFNSRLSTLESLSTMNLLNVLVLRGCDLLVEIKHIANLKFLSVLEISGASSLKVIPGDIFERMIQLRSLTLSALQIKELPWSFYELIELRWLIIKDCLCLKPMQSLKKFEKLLVLNLSGFTSLEIFPVKNMKPMQKLETLDLSDTRIKSMPIIRDLKALTHLSLSNCQGVDRLRSIMSVSNLQVLDLSGSSIKEIRDQSLENNHYLRILDLSRTQISRLPSNISNPFQLCLKGCLHLKELSRIASLKDLAMLDLSGAIGLEKIDDNFFENLTNLQVLNLSETKIKNLPPLSTPSNLRQLLLSRCSSLVKLAALNSLGKLEVLDISCCNALTAIEDESFEHMSQLQMLNLSNTKIETLPSLKNLSKLQLLSLKKCTNLNLVVEHLKTLSNLEELNLCGISSLTKADFLENMSQLRILDLSETQLEELPSMSNLIKLIHISLRGCQKVKTVPNLALLTKLEIIDLSGTAVSSLPSLEKCSNLRQLLPSGCLSTEEIKKLKMSDSSGVIIEEVRYGISESTQFDHVNLPNMSTRREDSRKLQQSLEQNWGISSLPGSFPDTNRPFMSVSNSEFFELLKKDSHLWEKSFKYFQFTVYPINEQNELRGIYLHKDELISRDIYFQARHFSHFKDQGRSFEINGFRRFPKDIDDVLSRSEYVFLFDNSFIKSLSDFGSKNIKAMRGCWIERCENMESVVLVEEVKEDTEKMENNLELISISYAIKLKSIYKRVECFRNLKCLYLECCPELPSVFSFSQRPEHLEILRISFCDKMKNLFENTSEDCILPKLRVLHLLELPEFKSFGCTFPSLQSLEVVECPMLQNDLSLRQLPRNLEILRISSCDKMKNLFKNRSEECTLPKLQVLHLWELPELKNIECELPSLQSLEVGKCPMLENVLSLCQLPRNLEIIKIRFCDELKTLFEGEISPDDELPKLHTLHLLLLPKLENFGPHFPSLRDCIVSQCPNLPGLISTEVEPSL